MPANVPGARSEARKELRGCLYRNRSLAFATWIQIPLVPRALRRWHCPCSLAGCVAVTASSRDREDTMKEPRQKQTPRIGRRYLQDPGSRRAESARRWRGSRAGAQRPRGRGGPPGSSTRRAARDAPTLLGRPRDRRRRTEEHGPDSPARDADGARRPPPWAVASIAAPRRIRRPPAPPATTTVITHTPLIRVVTYPEGRPGRCTATVPPRRQNYWVWGAGRRPALPPPPPLPRR